MNYQKEYFRLLALTTSMRATQKKYYRNRKTKNAKQFLDEALDMESQADDYIKEAHAAENNQQSLFHTNHSSNPDTVMYESQEMGIAFELPFISTEEEIAAAWLRGFIGLEDGERLTSRDVWEHLGTINAVLNPLGLVATNGGSHIYINRKTDLDSFFEGKIGDAINRLSIPRWAFIGERETAASWQCTANNRQTETIIHQTPEDVMFFQKLHEISPDLDVNIRIMAKDGKFTVSVLPETTDKIKALTVTATPAELDADFLNEVMQPVVAAATIEEQVARQLNKPKSATEEVKATGYADAGTATKENATEKGTPAEKKTRKSPSKKADRKPAESYAPETAEAASEDAGTPGGEDAAASERISEVVESVKEHLDQQASPDAEESVSEAAAPVEEVLAGDETSVEATPEEMPTGETEEAVPEADTVDPALESAEEESAFVTQSKPASLPKPSTSLF